METSTDKKIFAAAALAVTSVSTAFAAPNTFEIKVDTSIGFATPVDTYTLGITYDPDTIMATTDSDFAGQRSVVYNGVSGYLKKGTQTATVDELDISISANTLTRLHFLSFGYNVDDRSNWGPNPGIDPRFFDGDQNDGLTYSHQTTGVANGIDLNFIVFSFGSRTRDKVFDFSSPYLQDDFDFLNSADFVSRSGSIFERVTGFNAITSPRGHVPTLRSIEQVDTSTTSSVPLPAAGWMLLTGIAGLRLMRRRT